MCFKFALIWAMERFSLGFFCGGTAAAAISADGKCSLMTAMSLSNDEIIDSDVVVSDVQLFVPMLTTTLVISGYTAD